VKKEQQSSSNENDELADRLMNIENALFVLKMRSVCITSWRSSAEMERLEKKSQEFHEKYMK